MALQFSTAHPYKCGSMGSKGKKKKKQFEDFEDTPKYYELHHPSVFQTTFLTRMQEAWSLS